MGGFGWKEFISALIGALIAFLIDAFKRSREGASRCQDAANGAILDISQMLDELEGTHQTYEARAASVRARWNREPLAIEFPPHAHVSDFGIRLDLKALGFLIRSHDIDLPNRLAVAERRYVSIIAHEEERSRLAREFQQRLGVAGWKMGQNYSPEDAIAAVGEPLFYQITRLTEAQRAELPRTIEYLLKLKEELREAASLQFPLRRFVVIQKISDVPAQQLLVRPRAARWRYWLRNVKRRINERLKARK